MHSLISNANSKMMLKVNYTKLNTSSTLLVLLGRIEYESPSPPDTFFAKYIYWLLEHKNMNFINKLYQYAQCLS